MNKKILYATIIMIAIVSLLTITYAVTVFTTEQTLVVPDLTTSILTVYESDGVTEISEGQTISELWIWNTVENRYDLTLNLENNGASPITPVVSVGAISAWSLNYPEGVSIPVGATQPMIISMTPIPATTGKTATFTMSITVS